VIGAGIYLVWPAFYTDVTDSYRLGRRGRIRTDLGGLYFNAVVVVLTFVWWYATEWDALLLLVATQVMQMVHQLMPLLRFDGYHLLADMTGVPDLYHRIKPTLHALLPHRWFHPDNRVLKPWARAVITAWVLVTIPLLAFMLLSLVTALPRVLGSAWASAQANVADVQDAWRAGGLIDATGQVLQVLAVVLPVLAGLLILGRIGARWFGGLARWSRGSGLRRIAAAALSAVVLTTLFWSWWPQPGTYRPIEPGEKGLLTAVLPSSQHVRVSPAVSRTGFQVQGASAQRRLTGGAPLQATFPTGTALPSKAHPRLAIVLVPSGDTDGQSSNEPWVFPFDKPLPPAEGDNQAAAFNTTDDSATYDIAFALVWAKGDEVLNVNEAHAYASCSHCVTVAVAFQVVLIMDHAHVVVPQNLAVAANYECYECITAAIANQLVLSVEQTPGEEQLLALGDVWGRLTQFGNTITAYTFAQISAQLEAFKAEIVAILGDASPVPASTSPSPSPSASPTGAATGSSDPSPTSSSPTASSTSPTATSPTETTPSGPTSDPPTSTTPAPSSPSSTTGATTDAPSPSP
jgi:putative peptide zinc metalloprotease protein